MDFLLVGPNHSLRDGFSNDDDGRWCPDYSACFFFGNIVGDGNVNADRFTISAL